ncbi:MAG: TPM domain-containing protein, partial [Polyangiaceae bacterium]
MDRSQCLVWLRRMALACCVFWAAPAGAEVSVPTLSDPVTDLAGVLAREDRQQLNSQLQAHYAAGHAQLAVLILASTDGEPVDDFAFRVASAWQLGRAGADDGVLFVLATQDRRMRLEVGYGLEHCIPDATARAWLDELKPKLAEERYAAATQQLTGHLIEATQRCEPGSAVAPAPSKSRQQRSNPLLWMAVFFVGSVVGRVLVGVAGRNRAESKQARQASRRRAWALVVVLGGLAGLALWVFGLGWFYFSAGILGGLLGAFFLWRLRNVAGSL